MGSTVRRGLLRATVVRVLAARVGSADSGVRVLAARVGSAVSGGGIRARSVAPRIPRGGVMRVGVSTRGQEEGQDCEQGQSTHGLETVGGVARVSRWVAVPRTREGFTLAGATSNLSLSPVFPQATSPPQQLPQFSYAPR
ncbi:hypothetical protein D187_000396 [Cystobacter fuscus DSM 2262]|uniref:Uncharacterized protein n=1 Tax=Cystobacter fuscus (strain ATCC 25194 / DSM 2262 / NBRC 100088 / M29) TaxID=1242864 RepID=S9PPJ5_CYSF2|nr:hypothetical protein D187_000396 [Cystobacter fuscus DSM 2262]